MAEQPVAEIEEWRAIPGHPGYEASNLGRVRSVDRWITATDGRRWFRRGVVLQPSLRGIRYYGVAFGKIPPVYIHTTICTIFHGPRPSRHHEAAHRNGDPRDNRANNLRWATHQENEGDKKIHGTNPEGRRHGMVKLTEGEVLAIRRIHATKKLAQQAIADQFNVSRRMVGMIVNRTNWKHLP